MVVLMGKARYQRNHSAHYRGFKLATSMFVLSILDINLYSHIPQALHFYHYRIIMSSFLETTVLTTVTLIILAIWNEQHCQI